MKKILVVEETEGVRELVRKCLENYGFEVITPVLSLSEIEREFRKHHKSIVCVVSDGRINSEFGGVDVVKLVRGVDMRVPVLALTADGLIALDMMRAGAAAFVTKPFDLEVLSGVVKKIIGEG